jgi:hypothetical protein
MSVQASGMESPRAKLKLKINKNKNKNKNKKTKIPQKYRNNR